MPLTSTSVVFRTSIFSGTDAASYTTNTGAWTPASTSSLVMAIIQSNGSGASTSVTGNGVTFTQMAGKSASLGGTTTNVDIWVGSASSPTSGETTAAWATNRSGCNIMVLEITDLDLSGGSTGAFVQLVASTGTSQTGANTLAAASNSANRPLATWIHSANEQSSARTNWTELRDGNHANPSMGGECQWRSDAFETSCSSTWATNADYIGVAVELKSGTAATFTQGMRRLLLGVGR